MKTDVIIRYREDFEDYRQENDGIEFWFARDLQKLLDYAKWDNFKNVIEKAKESCKNAKQKPSDHFADVGKMIDIGKGGQRAMEDIMLTRYACYLIAQNSDPSKQEVAFAQSYFALQTRKQELLEERILLQERLDARNKLKDTETELSKNIYQKGVDDQGFARVRSKGDQALFGGYSTGEMKKKLKIPEKRALADFLPTITIKAKDLATEITNFNVKKDPKMKGEERITVEHVKNNKDVRGLLAKSGIKPETLPAEEDIKKLESRVKASEKSMPLESNTLPHA